MKHLVASILLILAMVCPAWANKASFVGYVKTAEQRFADGKLSAAQSYVTSARKDFDRLTPAERGDAEVAAALRRLDALEAKLENASAAADTAGRADDVVRKARTAKGYVGSTPKTERDLENATKCLSLISEALAIDPSVASRGADELRAQCTKLEAAGKAWLSGEGRQSPDDTDAGPIIRKGYDEAKAAVASSKAEATDVIAGQKAAESCLRGLAALESIVESSTSRKKYYDLAKAKVTTSDGPKTLAAVRDACKQMIRTLASRKVTGCGTKTLMVTQDYLGRGKWGSSSYSVGEQFDAVACREMPRKDSVARVAAAHRGRFKSLCSGGVIVVDGGWSEGTSSTGEKFRSIGGTCYAKGKLSFKIPSTWM